MTLTINYLSIYKMLNNCCLPPFFLGNSPRIHSNGAQKNHPRIGEWFWSLLSYLTVKWLKSPYGANIGRRVDLKAEIGLTATGEIHARRVGAVDLSRTPIAGILKTSNH